MEIQQDSINMEDTPNVLDMARIQYSSSASQSLFASDKILTHQSSIYLSQVSSINPNNNMILGSLYSENSFLSSVSDYSNLGNQLQNLIDLIDQQDDKQDYPQEIRQNMCFMRKNRNKKIFKPKIEKQKNRYICDNYDKDSNKSSIRSVVSRKNTKFSGFKVKTQQRVQIDLEDPSYTSRPSQGSQTCQQNYVQSVVNQIDGLSIKCSLKPGFSVCIKEFQE